MTKCSKNIIVTGGAGYIGSHACKALKRYGFNPITLDNLSTGWESSVKFGEFVCADLRNKSEVEIAFSKYKPIGVMHFAGSSLVGESIVDPGLYWENNVLGSLNLIKTATEFNCNNFVFSSTCAVYGEQDNVFFSEETRPEPINPYGFSKLAIEQILSNFERSHGLKHVVFRYFNVAGADPEAEIGEFHRPETHLIPLIFEKITGHRGPVEIFGTDYQTPDGTCIRDYVHVSDLIEAHIMGLRWLLDGKESSVFNLGTGHGHSVREVISAVQDVTKLIVPYKEVSRRPGDCMRLVSNSERANKVLNWNASNSDLKDIVSDAWRWYNSGEYTF